MKVIIFSIGQELTEGFYPDTNSEFLSKALTEIGFSVIRTEILPDNKNYLINAIKRGITEADAIITTGGIGPTDDDITREAFAEALSLPLELNNEELKRIKNLFKKSKFIYSKDNDRQAYFPKNALIILNRIGTASGFFIEKENTKIFVLPGVPHQAKTLFQRYVLKELSPESILLTKSFTAKAQNISEAKINEIFREQVSDESFQWGTLSKDDGIYLNIRANGDDAENTIKKAKEKLINVLGKFIWGWDNDEFPVLIGELLKKLGFTLSTAESCTGGLISKLVTDIPGSSKYYPGGIVAYSNEIKMNTLNVPEDILKKFGAVSEPVVIYMAENVKEKFNTECSIAVSGIAGPGGGTKEKPVGTVWVAISTPDKTITKNFIMPGNRDKIRLRTAYYAFGLLKQELEKY